MADLLPETLLVTDGHGTVTYVNQTCQRMFGYSLELLIGKASPEILLVPQDHRRLRRDLKKCLKGSRGKNTMSPRMISRA